MQKNLVLAVVLSSLVYIGWYSFMEKRLQPQIKQAQQAGTTATAAPAAAPSSSASSLPAPAALPVSADLKKETVAIKAGKAEFVFYSGAAAMKSAVYQGPVAPVELIPDQETGFFASSLPGVFRLKSRTADSLEFLLPGPADSALAGATVRVFRIPPGLEGCSHLYWRAFPRDRRQAPHLELALHKGRGCSASAFVNGTRPNSATSATGNPRRMTARQACRNSV